MASKIVENLMWLYKIVKDEMWLAWDSKGMNVASNIVKNGMLLARL